VKAQLRHRLSTARREVPAEVRCAEAAALASARLPVDPPGPVCAYWPVGAEPGSSALLDGLRERGYRVLLPVVDPAGPLDWAEYLGTDSMRAGPLGLHEPAGRRLGTGAIAQAALVLVPALAVDRRGVRLGRGGGHYDRTLPLAAPGTPLVAVVRDEELLASLPAEPHDVTVSAALTPGGGLVVLAPPA
jgi:5-formyltetrahydrofolate cyclo-ligase